MPCASPPPSWPTWARRIGEAADRALAIELELFDDCTGGGERERRPDRRAAAALATLDVAAGARRDWRDRAPYTRPGSTTRWPSQITGGRHPVVEAALRPPRRRRFVANDCALGSDDDSRLWLVTGPNMAGKSTFLRQNALIADPRAQAAPSCRRRRHIGVVDRLFSRVGAADDLARGRSTFMVEMVETAAILNQAWRRGRWSSSTRSGAARPPYDGLSIAWACVEHLHETNRLPRALFATHYHELNAPASAGPSLSCHAMKTAPERQGMGGRGRLPARGGAGRRPTASTASRSRGSPGCPEPAVARARGGARPWSSGGHSGAVGRLVDDLPLFQAMLHRPPRRRPVRNRAGPVERRWRRFRPTPGRRARRWRTPSAGA